jgi:hypothetical protein
MKAEGLLYLVDIFVCLKNSSSYGTSSFCHHLAFMVWATYLLLVSASESSFQHCFDLPPLLATSLQKPATGQCPVFHLGVS